MGLDSRLEKRLDNYAILHCFHFKPQEADKKALRFIKRVYGLNRKKRYSALMYYKTQKISCALIKKNLESFAESRKEMSEDEKKRHDKQARSFITEIFSEDTENFFYLIDYYNQLKSVYE
jgi:hypothetical protein